MDIGERSLRIEEVGVGDGREVVRGFLKRFFFFLGLRLVWGDGGYR